MFVCVGGLAAIVPGGGGLHRVVRVDSDGLSVSESESSLDGVVGDECDGGDCSGGLGR